MRHQTQAGASLMEVLVALVLLSIGLVGMAALQLKALESGLQGHRHSVAELALLDAEERFWALQRHALGAACTTAGVAADWQAHWFQDATPLAGATGRLRASPAAIVYAGLGVPACQVEVSITTHDGDTRESRFRIPREASP